MKATKIISYLFAVIALILLIQGIPMGTVNTYIEVVSSGTLTVTPPRSSPGEIAHYSDVKLDSGEIIRLSSFRGPIINGDVVLKRRFSLLEMKYIYQISKYK